VTMLYALLDQARERSEQELATALAGSGEGGTHQARLERDVSATEYGKRAFSRSADYGMNEIPNRNFCALYPAPSEFTRRN